jgi:aryl-alcohol dehydrogenase-like predicted oxidoreductase
VHGFLAHRLETIYTESFSQAVQKLKDNGLIIKSGVSVYSPQEAKTAIKNPLVEIIQIPFNILDRRWIDEGIIEKVQKNNIQLFFRSVFLQGLLFLNNNELNKLQMGWAIPYLNQFNQLVSETSLTPMELSFSLLCNIPGDNIIIMGVDNLGQLQKNIKIAKKVKQDEALSDKWWSSIPVFPEKLLNPTLWN